MWVRNMISSDVWSSILLVFLQGVIIRYNCTCPLSSPDQVRMSASQGSRFFQMRLLNQMLTQICSQLFTLTDLDTMEDIFKRCIFFTLLFIMYRATRTGSILQHNIHYYAEMLFIVCKILFFFFPLK